MNTDLRKKKKRFEEDFFKLMNNVFFRKNMETVRKRSNIKPVTTEKRRNLLSEPNYQTTNSFCKDLLAIEM